MNFETGSIKKDDSDKLFIYKYQPFYFDDFVIDPDTIMLLNTFISMNHLNLLFVGNAGSGKTSLMNALVAKYYNTNVKSLNGNDNDEMTSSVYHLQPKHYYENVLHINSLKEQGVNFYRNEVKTFCQTRSIIPNKKKIVILDDIDMINEQSQQVFRNCIDKYSGNVHFISSCSDTQKVIESMQSRLVIVKINSFTRENLKMILDKIKINEQIIIEEDAEEFVLSICDNAVKTLINYMEKFKLLDVDITLPIAMNVCTNISFLEFEKYTEKIKAKRLKDAIQILYDIYDKGYSVMDILDNYSLFVKMTSALSENDKYAIISCICKYVTIFHNTHEEPIELALFTNNVIKMT
jgi:DNA polymerase III delta prime subunit